MNAIQIEKLSVYVENKKILNDINLNIKKGEMVAILGKNGNGKTSIFKAIMNHYSFKIEGKIFLNNINISNKFTDEISKLGIWYVPQISNEIKGLKIIDFLKSIVESRGNFDIKKFYIDLEHYLGILKFNNNIEERYLNVNFSGGEKKKLELLQLLLVNPDVILLDEIDSGLDTATVEILIKIILDLQKRNKTIIIITHSNELLKNLPFDRFLFIENGKVLKDEQKVLEN